MDGDEQERRLSAWEEDNEEEEEAKKEYLSDLMRQKTNTAINRKESATDSELHTEINESEMPDDEEEGESGSDDDQRLKHVKHDLAADEEQRAEGGITKAKTFVADEHFEDDDTGADNEKGAPMQKKKTVIERAANKVRHRVSWGAFKMRGYLKRAIEGEDPWAEMGILQKILYVIADAPWDFLRRLTTPPPCGDMWFRGFAVVWPIPAVVFFYITNSLIPYNGDALPISFYVALGVGLIASIAFYFTTHPNQPPRYILLFALFAFLMSILWINWISNVLIDLLGLLGLMFGIPSAYLGITILAWGNSVGDTVANCGVAKRGLARMAITGCFAGPFFNLCVGLGISMTMQNLKTKKVPDFQFTEHQALLPMLVTLPLIAMLIMIIISVSIQKFELKKPQGYVQIVYFIATLFIVTIAAFGFPKEHL